MNTPISFTLSEFLGVILSICGAVITVSACITIFINWHNKSKEPEITQNERIAVLEKKAERFEQLFDNDNKRLIELEKGNRVMQQSMLALLSHALNGNDIDSLKKAKTNLENYLIGREE